MGNCKSMNHEEVQEKKRRLESLKQTVENNRKHIPEDILKTKYKAGYETVLNEISCLEEELGSGHEEAPR